MFCANCGVELPTSARFCPSCGTPAHGHQSANTTVTFDIGALDEHHELLEGVPELAHGTGMFVVVRGPNAGARFLLDREKTAIGRNPGAELFLDDVTVSRDHAEVVRTDDGLLVRDLQSMNGTYVEGKRVESSLLRTGMEVQVGRFRLVFVGSERS